jgi:hypothetical protein
MYSPEPSDNGLSTARNVDTGLETSGLIINADDWGRNCGTSDRTLDCIRSGTVSSVSAMVFMEDSERAAEIARDYGIDAGLHLNFTTSFSGPGVPSQLAVHRGRISEYLLRHRLSQVIFHPGLISSFEYVTAAQRDEFSRLYGHEPQRLDGHHHMHLCANVLLGGLLPPRTIVRRSFSFQPGEKSFVNRLYRQAIDRHLGRQHRMTDFFFSIQPLASSSRLQKILNLSRQFVVEMETHPEESDEYLFLTGDGIRHLAENCSVASRYYAASSTSK